MVGAGGVGPQYVSQMTQHNQTSTRKDAAGNKRNWTRYRRDIDITNIITGNILKEFHSFHEIFWCQVSSITSDIITGGMKISLDLPVVDTTQLLLDTTMTQSRKISLDLPVVDTTQLLLDTNNLTLADSRQMSEVEVDGKVRMLKNCFFV